MLSCLDMSDSDKTFTQTCICGCIFTGLTAFTWHEKGCVKGKKHLSGALSKAKEVYRNKKVHVQGAMDLGQDALESNLAILEQQAKEHGPVDPAFVERESNTVCKWHFDQGCYTDVLTHWNKDHIEPQPSDDSLPLAQQRPRHLHQRLPACYRDFLPEPPRPLPPMEAWENPREIKPLNLSHLPNELAPCEASHVPSPPLRPKFKTQLNSFGLFWLYDEDSLPIIDPDTNNSLDKAGLSAPCNRDTSSQSMETITTGSNPFYPYPNETSLLLGDWYWNQGHQKSRTSFRKLQDIIGHPGYDPGNVQNTNWAWIDWELGSSDVWGDKTKADCEWLDDDSRWKKRAIQISIPFHRHTGNPGAKEYIVEDFHYRSLVEIIWENVSDSTHHRLFHYEPYELCWHPPHKTQDVRVYNELYSSESFLAAHHQLQDLLPESGCTLPQRIIRLMLWLDATHLTAFRMAKLWPLYVYMSNESKYMHCRPLSNLCSHAAYFHMVSHPVLFHLLKWNESSPMHSKILQQRLQVTTPLGTVSSHIATGNCFMCSGKSRLTMNSLKCITMGLSATAMMGSIIDFIPKYLPIQPIIPKSELTPFCTCFEADLDHSEFL